MREPSQSKRVFWLGHRALGLGIVWLTLHCQGALGQAQQEPASAASDLTEVSIENLMNMEVTSASKKEQKLSRVAAAIFVITKEDIRRSGATNIPDLLRMVPGVNVGRSTRTRGRSACGG